MADAALIFITAISPNWVSVSSIWFNWVTNARWLSRDSSMSMHKLANQRAAMRGLTSESLNLAGGGAARAAVVIRDGKANRNLANPAEVAGFVRTGGFFSELFDPNKDGPVPGNTFEYESSVGF